MTASEDTPCLHGGLVTCGVYSCVGPKMKFPPCLLAPRMGATMEEAFISDNPDIFCAQIFWGAFKNRVLLSSSGQEPTATVKV